MPRANSQRSVTTAPGAALVRKLGLVSATALVVANMIGTGIFSSTGFLAGDLGSPGIVLVIWVVGAACALVGALCYSELGVNFPASGGEYLYLTKAYGPMLGFMSGWVSFFAGFSAPIAAAALACSDYVGFFSPAMKVANAPTVLKIGNADWKLGGAQIAACLLIASFTVLNCFGVQVVARVQNLLTGIKVTAILGFIVLGLALGKGDWHNFSVPAARWTATPLASQFAISLFWIYVAYSGWNAATYIAEEIRDPGRTLPRALVIGTILVAALYLALNVVYIYGVPLERMKGVLAVGSLSASRLFGARVAGIFSALMAVSLMATVNAMVTIGPRVYYAMARNRAFFPPAGKINPRSHVPVFAVVSQGSCAMLMALTPFADLVQYIGILLNLFAVLAVASLFFFRGREGWRKLGVVSFAYPCLPLLFVTVGSWMTYQGISQRPRVALAAAITLAIGGIVYRATLGERAAPVESEPQLNR